MTRGQKIFPPGTRNHRNFVAGATGGHLNIVPDKGDVEVKIPTPAVEKFDEKELPAEVVEQLDAVGPASESLEGPNPLKIEAEAMKTTGDVKSDKGFAKASPKFKEVEPKAQASVDDEKKAIEDNTIEEKKEEEAENDA